MVHEEYLRRNLTVAKAGGIVANSESAIGRLSAMKRPPKWLIEVLRGIHDQAAPLPAELAAWRNSAADAPEYSAQRAQAQKDQA